MEGILVTIAIAGGLALGATGALLVLRARGRAARTAAAPRRDPGGEPPSPDSAGCAEALAHVVRQLGESREGEARARKRQDELESACADLEGQAARADQELRGARAALLESEERFRALAEHGFDAILETDGGGRLLWGSPNTELVLGVAASALEGRPLSDLVHAEDRAAAAKAFRRGAASGNPAQSVFRFGPSQGPWRWLEANGKTYRTAAGEIRRILVARDVTDRKRDELQRVKLEEQLRHSQKMEAVGRLAGGVAHDFNNLLTAISGYAHLVLDKLSRNHRARADVEEIRDAAERAATLTRQLLAFSRRQLLQPRILDLRDVLADLQKMLRRIIGEDIRLTTRLGPEPTRVHADRGQIEQVILNLAVNARDAMPHGGILTLETTRVVLDAAWARAHLGVKPGRHVLLAVSDSGCGMPEEVRRRAFEPFFTTKEEGKGTGLGLSTVYGIVQQSGGTIWVYSEEGHGTTFKIYLPLVDAEGEPTPPPAPAPMEAAGQGTILVVEDEPAVRRLAARILRDRGYQVLEAEDPDAARQLFAEHGAAIDGVVTDVVMPGSLGPALVAELRASRPDLPALYTSGYTEGAVFEREVLEPGAPFLQKPFMPEAFARAVAEILARRR
jgi:PAS domain S-box-containing protein